MTTALATTTPGGFTPQSIQDAQNLATELAKSMLVPKDFKGKPADVFAAITYGAELGLAPWAAMQSLIVIHGRVTMYADAMVALVLASNECEFFRCVESSDASVTYETLRRGSKPTSYTFTADDAKRAELLSNANYKKFPQRMLGARAKSFLARDVYPDIMRGLQSYEEIIDIEPAGVVDVSAYEAPEEVSPAQQDAESSALEQILACAEPAELEALASTLATLKGDERDRARELYKSHMAALKGAQ